MKELVKQLRELLGDEWSVDPAGALEIEIRPKRRADLTFDLLADVSKVCKTRDINLRYHEGWGGSEVTPGDPTELVITVTLPVEAKPPRRRGRG